MAKTHFHPQMSREVTAVNRVAIYCGAITHHAEPQAFVKETSTRELVDCRWCLKRLRWDY